MLEGGDEGQLDRLAGDGDGVGLLVPVGGGLPQAVRERLQPRDVGPGHHLDRADPGPGGRRLQVLRQHPPSPPVEGIQAGVGGDAVQPGPQRRPALEAADVPPRPQERLLHQVLGLLDRTDHAIAMHPQLTAVTLDHPGERRLVTGPGSRNHRVVPVGGMGVHAAKATATGPVSRCRRALRRPSIAGSLRLATPATTRDLRQNGT